MRHQPEQPVQTILEAYRAGFFPMADGGAAERGGRIRWLNPDPRGIIPLTPEEGLHLPRRLRERARSGKFHITTDHAFEAVMRGCALPRPDEPETWIDERIIGAYTALFRAGHAHSIEAWLTSGLSRPADGGATARDHPLARWVPPGGAALVGGLYGVHIGGAFFAESKFSLPAFGGTDASKVCLAHLIAHLRRRGFTLLDSQFWNPHIDQFGCREVPRDEYLARLAPAVARQVSWVPFDPAAIRGEIMRG